jgi:cyclin-dependent kinase 12/13
MGCVHGRPSAPSPDRPPPQPPEPPAPAPPQEAAATAAGKPEQPAEKPARRERRSRSSRPAPGGSFANRARGEQVAAGWPAWLSAVAGEAIDGWTPRRADSFEKIDKVRARALDSGTPALPSIAPRQLRGVWRPPLA